MTEQRPPPKPGLPTRQPPARPPGRGGPGENEATAIVAQPSPHAPAAASDLGGFEDSVDTNIGIHHLVTDDVSLIDAPENGPAPSDPDFATPPRASMFMGAPGASDGAFFEDTQHTATEVLRLSELGHEADRSAAEPVEVLKWRFGGNAPPADAPRPLPAVAEGEMRARPGGALALPRTDHEPTPRHTRVDGNPVQAAAFAVDVDELRRVLEEAERLLTTVKTQVSGLDLEARGVNAQLAAVHHRLSEALAIIKRS